MPRQLRSFVSGLGLALGAVLLTAVAAEEAILPPRAVPALVAGGAMLFFALLARGSFAVRTGSIGSLTWGAACGIGCAVVWATLSIPPLWGAAAAIAVGLSAPVGNGRGQVRATPAYRPLLAALIAAVATLVSLLRWNMAGGLLGPPWYGPTLAVAAALVALAAGMLVGGWLRRRFGLFRHTAWHTPVTLVGLAGLLTLALPPDSEALRELATRVQRASFTFGTFLLGATILSLRVLGPVTFVAGVVLGFVYRAGRGHPHAMRSAFIPLFVGSLVVALPPAEVFEARTPSPEDCPWIGLYSVTSDAWPPSSEREVKEIAGLASLLARFPAAPLLLVGCPELASELRESGHELTVEIGSGSLIAEHLREMESGPFFQVVVFGTPSAQQGASTQVIGRALLRRLKRQLRPGSSIMLIEHLGRLRTCDIAAALGMLKEVMGSAHAWVAGEHLVLVGGHPMHLWEGLRAAVEAGIAHLPWLLLDSTGAAGFADAHAPPHATPVHLEWPKWQRRLQPWDPFLAARNIRILLAASSWPEGPFAASGDLVGSYLLAGRYRLSAVAARLEVDERLERQILALGLSVFPGDPILAELAQTQLPHYAALESRARSALAADPTDAAAHLVAGRLAFARGEWQEAKEHITGGAIKWRKNFVDAYPFAADLLEAGGRLEWARGVVEENGFPHAGRHPDVLEAAVRGYGAAGELERARELLDELADSDPARPGLHRLRGHLAISRGDAHAAARSLELARHEDPFDDRIYRDLVAALERLGRDEEAAGQRAILERLERY
ncbi:MAG: hypothetical protein AB1486_29255 [Planctomycetota bacterium]